MCLCYSCLMTSYALSVAVLREINTGNHFPSGPLFLIADPTYVLLSVISNSIAIMTRLYDMIFGSVWDDRYPVIFYSDLIFILSMSAVDLTNYLHTLRRVDRPVLIGLLCIIRACTLARAIRRRFRRHQNDLLVAKSLRFSMASEEDLEKNVQDCVICWEAMGSARKLPCGHLFHDPCLSTWLKRNMSCPICRIFPEAQPDNIVDGVLGTSENVEEFPDAGGSQQRDRLRDLNSSRYTNSTFLRWLPTISTECFM